MSANEQYRLLRNLLRELESRDSLAVIWAYSQFLQIRGFRFPAGIEVNDRFLRADLPQGMISEWTLEQMAREVVRYAGPAAQRGKTLRTWATMATAAQGVKDLEDQIYAEFSDPAQIHLELMRIAHRQFIWQQQRPKTELLVRYFKLFNRADIDAICVDITGLSVREIYLIGLLFFGIFSSNARSLQRMRIEVPGLTQEHIDRFLAFTALSLEGLRRKLQAEHILDGNYPYRWSSLREFPLVRMRFGGVDEIADTATLAGNKRPLLHSDATP